jgi:hypothetical protein
MPYIKQKDRERAKFEPVSPGELNFAITSIIQAYWNSKPWPSYTTINDIIGALEGAKLEFYRRIVVPYEEEKMAANGDVYGS